jgi:pyruvate dehydrogenase E2 component (dihydrolipoamide acetyltransferase)
MAVELFVHKMSEHMETARIVQWLVKEGDIVQQFQILMEVETDKAVAELESPASGVLKGIRPGAVDGAEVKVGEVIAFIAAPDEKVPPLAPLSAAGAAERISSPLPSGDSQGKRLSPPLSGEGQGEGSELRVENLRATPVARRVAKELGIELSKVTGTGPEGRIKEEDVRAYVESKSDTAQKSVYPAPTGTIELTHNQRLTGQRMLESLQTAPQFSLSLSVDMTFALRLRDSLAEQMEGEPKPTITAILVKASADALKRYPRANAAFKENHLVAQPQINIGVALASGGELIAPVIHSADQFTLTHVARQIAAFQEKGQQLRFTLQDLSGGTFTVSNLGMYGIERFNAILVPSQSAILAVGKIIKTPVAYEESGIILRPILILTLTVDHRVLDGVQAAQFLDEIRQILENPSWNM